MKVRTHLICHHPLCHKLGDLAKMGNLACEHGGWDKIGSCVGLLAAIFIMLFPLNRRSLFTMWLLLPAVPLLLLPAVPLLLLPLVVPLLK
jgi:hypothetical protein